RRTHRRRPLPDTATRWSPPAPSAAGRSGDRGAVPGEPTGGGPAPTHCLRRNSPSLILLCLGDQHGHPAHGFDETAAERSRTPKLTCCRKPQRGTSVGWRQSGAVLCSAGNASWARVSVPIDFHTIYVTPDARAATPHSFPTPAYRITSVA